MSPRLLLMQPLPLHCPLHSIPFMTNVSIDSCLPACVRYVMVHKICVSSKESVLVKLPVSLLTGLKSVWTLSKFSIWTKNCRLCTSLKSSLNYCWSRTAQLLQWLLHGLGCLKFSSRQRHTFFSSRYTDWYPIPCVSKNLQGTRAWNWPLGAEVTTACWCTPP
jgi:hypothetical protein